MITERWFSRSDLRPGRHMRAAIAGLIFVAMISIDIRTGHLGQSDAAQTTPSQSQIMVTVVPFDPSELTVTAFAD